jgi:hypothetical protein
MKNTILTIIAIFTILSVNSQALSKSGGNIKAGVRIGFVGSQISGDDLAGYNKLGAYTGLFANLPISKNGKWHFQMELNFIMKGSSSNITAQEDGTLGDFYVLTMLYTETPFLFQYNFGTFKRPNGNFLDFDLELGPTLNFLFYQKERNQSGDIYRPAEQLFNIWDIGIIVGLKCTISDRSSLSFRWGSSIYPVRIPDFVYNRIIKSQYNDHVAISYCYHF